MDIKQRNTNFSIEDLLNPNKQISKNAFKVDYLPMWKFLDSWERKLIHGFKDVEMKEIFERIYEYATISVSLDKADTQTRIDNLNSENLKWCTKALAYEQEIEVLKQKLLENQPTNTNS